VWLRSGAVLGGNIEGWPHIIWEATTWVLLTVTLAALHGNMTMEQSAINI